LRQKFDAWIETYEKKKKGEGETPASPGPSAPAYNTDSTFEWVIYDLAPMLFRMIEKSDLSNRDTADALSHIVKVLAVEFGVPFTKRMLEPSFKTLIIRHSKSQRPDGMCDPPRVNMYAKQCLLGRLAFLRRARIAVAYASAILTNFEAVEFKNFVKSLIVDISLKQNAWTQIKFPVLQDMILTLKCVKFG